MNLSIETKQSGDVTVLGLTGNLALGDECDSLRSQVTQMVTAGNKKILLDMGGVRRVDSSGIGVLVEAVVLASKEGGRLKLCGVPRLLYNTLTLHHLVQAFEIFQSEADALASFG